MTKRRPHDPVTGEHVPLRGADDDATEAMLRQRIEAARARGDLEAHAAAASSLALFCSRSGRQRHAIAALEGLAAAAGGSPNVAADALLQAGQLLEQARDYEAACEVYARGARIETSDPRTRYFLRNNLAYCLLALGRPAEAEPHCRAAIAAEPRRHNAHKNLGLALAAQGRANEAAAAYLDAAERAPQDTRAMRHLREVIEESPTALDADPELKRRMERAMEVLTWRAKRLH